MKETSELIKELKHFPANSGGHMQVYCELKGRLDILMLWHSSLRPCGCHEEPKSKKGFVDCNLQKKIQEITEALK